MLVVKNKVVLLQEILQLSGYNFFTAGSENLNDRKRSFFGTGVTLDNFQNIFKFPGKMLKFTISNIISIYCSLRFPQNRLFMPDLPLDADLHDIRAQRKDVRLLGPSHLTSSILNFLPLLFSSEF